MNTRQTLEYLREYESRNLTFIEPDGSWPIVWERARGAHVWDAEGKKYLDLTAAFGVAAAGHANPRVVKAGQRQMARLLHAMGDVHPHALKAQLARELSRRTFERWTAPNSKNMVQPGAPASLPANPGGRPLAGKDAGAPSNPAQGKTIFCNSGFEAVEAALKTARLATGKPGILAFAGAYHGLGYGALNVTHREYFRVPFRGQLAEFGHFVSFPSEPDELKPLAEAIEKLLRREPIGAVLVEPMQARGGINIPPPGFLPLLRRLCDQHQALLLLDEIYTGFGRTGKWFACEHTGTVPDVICLGKALTGGFPLSACVGRADVMDVAWPPSPGEAIHTSTFLGHPVGCAMALAQITEIETQGLVERGARLGEFLLGLLASIAPSTDAPGIRLRARGIGLLAGLELRAADGSPATAVALNLVKNLLHQGFILLPEGEHSNVISFTPPLTISEKQLVSAVSALEEDIETLDCASEAHGRSASRQSRRRRTQVSTAVRSHHPGGMKEGSRGSRLGETPGAATTGDCIPEGCQKATPKPAAGQDTSGAL